MKIALVLGGAACVFADFLWANSLGVSYRLVGVNDIRDDFPDLDIWVTLHPEKFPDAFAPSVDFPELWEPGGSSGSSGLFAVRCAIERLGADRVILCGVPMDTQPHFYGGDPWLAADGFWPAWIVAMPYIKNRVRSMSGRTRDLLGAPTAEWLAG